MAAASLAAALASKVSIAEAGLAGTPRASKPDTASASASCLIYRLFSY
jgi:hypothetical protein